MADTVVGTCEIDLPTTLTLGTFANAIRIVPDTNNDHFIDFLIYSSSEKKAMVVSRIRVHDTMLAPIRDRISAVIVEAPPRSGPSLHVVPFVPPSRSDDEPDPAV